ncbi:rod shape-determining protein RodA [Mumia sp. zg.B53]|uniref:rod shape-determining protein RodA n=1 Tax=unclassified Mumia TaxID=2621872 RepID=UPI001C6E4098|nr:MULTISPECIES: rod shape-determining protein RodA [unclassified Mumia]MBW9211181.1 rod shape-determining protein RodA [Mumia sp. zg.B21]MBW9215755.1 rod shape-determining protein RodA [Mumia sp. zg.B53]
MSGRGTVRPALRPGASVRTSWGDVDLPLVASALALSVVGTLLVWSATASRDDLTGGDPTAYLVKQATNVVIAVGLGVVMASTDRRWIRLWAPVVYGAAVLGLVLVFVPGVGAVVNGSRSWLQVGGLSLQPAELAKLGVVLVMALLFAERTEGRMRRVVRSSDVLLALACAAVPAALILAQPDLGTLMVMAAIVLGVLAVAGVRLLWLGGLVTVGLAVVLGAIAVGVIEEYQVLRFEAFTDPELDPRGAGYNTVQARIAIGNGGLLGQGLFHGTQTQAGFVPEQHTDFVFTVAGEELGLLGAGLVVLLLGVLVWRCLRIAARADDLFDRLAAAGIGCWFGFQAFQNIGMSLGIMPITGVPLPFVSYGGTALFASAMAVGLLVAIGRRSAPPAVVVRSRATRSR